VRCRATGHRQSHENSGALAHWLQFAGDVHLVVVHAYHAVELAGQRAHKDGIGRDRAGNIEPCGPCVGDGRSDGVDLLATEQAPFAAVNVQRGHCDARAGPPNLEQGCLQLLNEPEHTLAGDEIRDVAKGDVLRDAHRPDPVHDAQRVSVWTAGQIRHELHLIGIVVSGAVKGLLVHGGSHQALNLAAQRQAHALCDAERRAPAPLRAHHATRSVDGAQVGRGQHVQRARPERGFLRGGNGAHGQRRSQQGDRVCHHFGIRDRERPAQGIHLWILQHLDGDLGADPRGVSHGDGDNGPLHEANSFRGVSR